jgi:hypothetical protein
MLRVLLVALAVLLALRVIARALAPRAPQGGGVARTPSAQAPALTGEERARLEAERGRALREGRQLDAIRIQRRLGGFDGNEADSGASREG